MRGEWCHRAYRGVRRGWAIELLWGTSLEARKVLPRNSVSSWILVGPERLKDGVHSRRIVPLECEVYTSPQIPLGLGGDAQWTSTVFDHTCPDPSLNNECEPFRVLHTSWVHAFYWTSHTHPCPRHQCPHRHFGEQI